MGIHDGHRDRFKEKFLDHGPESFEDHELLELLLFFAIPVRETNTLAHDLINKFGGFSEVFDTSAEELCTVKGVSKHTATLIKLVPQIAKKYSILKLEQEFNNILDNSSTAGKYLKPRFAGERDEVVYMICMDAKCKILDTKLLFRGSVNSANISIRKIVENALSFNATKVVIAHNHTSGIALPSHEDRDTTIKIKNALAAVDVVLLDHLVMTEDDFVSMADSGYI